MGPTVLYSLLFLSIMAAPYSCADGNNCTCSGCLGSSDCGGCAAICQPQQCNTCVSQCQTTQCQQTCIRRASCEVQKQQSVQPPVQQPSNVQNSQSSHSENTVDNQLIFNLSNVVTNDNRIHTPVNVDVQNVNNVHFEAASMRTVERIIITPTPPEVITSKPIPCEVTTCKPTSCEGTNCKATACKVEACERKPCEQQTCEPTCETNQCSERVVHVAVPQPYPVRVPVPVPQPYPVRVPVHVPVQAPQQCCTVVQPCVHQGCQSYRQECGSHCSAQMVYRASNPCQNNNCYQRDHFNRYSCAQGSCGFVRQDCSHCSQDNFYKSYENYASCHGCFYSGSNNYYGGNYGGGRAFHI